MEEFRHKNKDKLKLIEDVVLQADNFSKEELLILHNINILHASKAFETKQGFNFNRLGKFMIKDGRLTGLNYFDNYVKANNIDLHSLSDQQYKKLYMKVLYIQKDVIARKENNSPSLLFKKQLNKC